MNCELLKNNAYSFKKAFERCFETRQKSTDTFEMLAVPTIVNLVFSLELSLKYILFKSGNKPLSHNLKNLFNLINAPTKVEIIKNTGFGELQLDKELTKHTNIFIEWRYLHEKTEANVNIDFLLAFSNALELHLKTE